MEETTACVALGSNLGEPAVTLEKAAGRMSGILPGVRLAACSRLWMTAPLELERMPVMVLPEVLRVRMELNAARGLMEPGTDRDEGRVPGEHGEQGSVIRQEIAPAIPAEAQGYRPYPEDAGYSQGPAIMIRPSARDAAAGRPVRQLPAYPEVRPAPWYANMVVRLECGPGVTPESLFEALMHLEAELGRNRLMERRWGPRLIDIDLLTFGCEQRSTQRLTLPHPRMLERAFVVLPLSEVAPELVSPEIFQRLSFVSSGTMIF